MHFHSITVAAAFLSAAAAMPCSDIGWSSGIEGANPALDPFDPQGRWEVVKAKECWVRFQTFEPGQNPKDVRVTKTEFTATPAQVLGTINNYFGGPGNIMLWLPMATKSFQYVRTVLIVVAHILTQLGCKLFLKNLMCHPMCFAGLRGPNLSSYYNILIYYRRIFCRRK